MLILKYLNSENEYQVGFSRISKHIVEIGGDLPIETSGFTLSREGSEDNWDYSTFTTINKRGAGFVWFSNDGSVTEEPVVAPVYHTVYFEGEDGISIEFDSTQVEDGTLFTDIKYPKVECPENIEFVKWNIPEGEVNADASVVAVVKRFYEITFEPGDGITLSKTSARVEEGTLLQDIEFPEVTELDGASFMGWSETDGMVTYDMTIFPIVTSFDDLREETARRMNEIQQQLIHSGVTVTFASGESETFTLTENDQLSLMELQAMASQGAPMIPWHNNNHDEGCKYYSLADFMTLSGAVIPFVTYHVTYFRDLRRYIMSIQTKEELSAVQYGMMIPEEFQSDVLKQIYAEQAKQLQEGNQENTSEDTSEDTQGEA